MNICHIYQAEGGNMPITPLEIRKQEFKKKVRGYDPHEVRDFLEMLVTEIEVSSPRAF